MRFVKFEDALPTDIITEIHFDTCNDSVVCKLLVQNDQGFWWAIFSEGLPTRFICIKDYRGLLKFATRYGYMDKNDCVNFKRGKFGISKMFKPPTEYVQLEKTLQFLIKTYKHGIPQKSLNSGLCWYSAMCFACFFCKQMRDLIKFYSRDITINRLIDTCLHNADDAEKLRRYLFFEYHIGDDPRQRPEDDGQNGMSEFLTLVAKLHIPCVRLFAPSLSEIRTEVSDKRNDVYPMVKPTKFTPSLLVVRCFRTRWKPKLIIKHDDMRYKLASVMIGSEYCGHQIGASTCDLRVCRWGCADADACREGIGPIFWTVKRQPSENIPDFLSRWWDAWGKMLPVVLFNNNSLCDFSPHNRSSCTLESRMNRNQMCTDFDAGVVNSDFVYIHLPTSQ